MRCPITLFGTRRMTSARKPDPAPWHTQAGCAIVGKSAQPCSETLAIAGRARLMGQSLSIPTRARCAWPVCRCARLARWATIQICRSFGSKRTRVCNVDFAPMSAPKRQSLLQPQLDLTDAAFTQSILNEEEPFACVECGTFSASNRLSRKIIEKLAGNHAMFANPAAARMIQMCDDCRINAQYHSDNNPLRRRREPAPAHDRRLSVKA